MTITDEQAIEMGRGVVAWDGFGWEPRMVTTSDETVLDVSAAGVVTIADLVWVGADCQQYQDHERIPAADMQPPDLRDRPTQAAVLEQIEKALSAPCHIQPTAYFVTDNGRKCWRVHCAGVFAHAGSRAEAIAAAVRELSADPPWYLDEKTRETGVKWPAACAYFINLDPDEYPDQPGCDRCGHPKSEGHR